jgi:drug/metabolite transporter (DMT)-like permease
MVVAAIWLGEPLGAVQIFGAATILGGVFISRLSAGSTPAVPAE